MSDPLDREEREALLYLSRSATGQVPWEDIARYEATVIHLEKALTDIADSTSRSPGVLRVRARSALDG